MKDKNISIDLQILLQQTTTVIQAVIIHLISSPSTGTNLRNPIMFSYYYLFSYLLWKLNDFTAKAKIVAKNTQNPTTTIPAIPT